MDSLGNIPEVHSISERLDYAIPVLMAPPNHLEDPADNLPPESGWMVLGKTGHWAHDSRDTNRISELQNLQNNQLLPHKISGIWVSSEIPLLSLIMFCVLIWETFAKIFTSCKYFYGSIKQTANHINIHHKIISKCGDILTNRKASVCWKYHNIPQSCQDFSEIKIVMFKRIVSLPIPSCQYIRLHSVLHWVCPIRTLHIWNNYLCKFCCRRWFPARLVVFELHLPWIIFSWLRLL